jgi:hypothetical protein
MNFYHHREDRIFADLIAMMRRVRYLERSNASHADDVTTRMGAQQADMTGELGKLLMIYSAYDLISETDQAELIETVIQMADEWHRSEPRRPIELCKSLIWSDLYRSLNLFHYKAISTDELETVRSVLNQIGNEIHQNKYSPM